MFEYQRLQSLTEELRKPGMRIDITRQEPPHILAYQMDGEYTRLYGGIALQSLFALGNLQAKIGMPFVLGEKMIGDFRRSAAHNLNGPEDYIDKWLFSDGRNYVSFFNKGGIFITAEARIMNGSTPHFATDKLVVQNEHPNLWDAYVTLNFLLGQIDLEKLEK